MTPSKLRTCFHEGKSVFAVCLDLFPLCLSHGTTIHGYKSSASLEELVNHINKVVFEWASDLEGRKHLTPRDVIAIKELIADTVKSERDVLLFAEAFIRAIDHTHHHHVQRFFNGLQGGELFHEAENGYIVPKHADYPKLLEKSVGRSCKKMLSRRELWNTHLPARLNHLHFIPSSWNGKKIQVIRLPEPLATEWSEAETFKIALSQLHVDPVFQCNGTSYTRKERFCIARANNEEEIFERMCKEITLAFRANASVMLFPELLFPAEKEDALIRFLTEQCYAHQRSLLVIAGYLHKQNADGDWENTAACFVPKLDEWDDITYMVLCRETKKEPVTFKQRADAASRISAQAYEKGAIEDIVPGSSWTILETPVGRVCFVICKDFLSLDKSFVEELEIDLLLVSAMTPKMEEKFEHTANTLRGMGLTTIVIANNGWPVETTGVRQNDHSYATAPLYKVNRAEKKGVPYEQFYKRFPQQRGTIGVFTL